MRNKIIFLVAVSGFLLTAYIIYHSQKSLIFIETVPPPLASPYNNFIACQGIVESLYKNIFVGSSFSDIVTEVYVTVGENVKQGQPLFKTDSRKLEAQYLEAVKELNIAKEEYALQDKIFNFYESLVDKDAVSKQSYTQAQYNKLIAANKREKAQATVEIYRTELERCIVRAPIDGKILQNNIRVGQYALQKGINDTPLMLFGDTESYHLRIDIDEEDAWRFIEGAPGFAYIRGSSSFKIPIEFVYLEPYIIAKKSLTGDDKERTDTRVLQVVYAFKKEKFPVFAGELLDVYLEALAHESVV